jgi:leucine dehydrogenase
VLEDLISAWDGEQVVVGFDEPSGTWMFVCIHSTKRGPAGGGTRMKAYPSPAAGLEDAMRLSSAMTLKMAAVDVPFGGGKAVLAVPALPEGAERRRLLLRYAELAAKLGPNFQTGPDVNTTSADMDVIAERHPYVFARSERNGGSGDPGPYTARGVFHGIRATVTHVYGSPDLNGRVVLVQGVGDVGARLAEQLAEAGARVLVADVDRPRVDALAERIGAEVVPPEDAIGAECDVYAPCALGATLTAETVPRLRCRIVAGCANNQLAESADAARLHEAGILYAPDYVINAGGLINVYGELEGWSRERSKRKAGDIYNSLLRIFDLAKSERIPTETAANHVAEERLREARQLQRTYLP